jgi:AcrR family transcriptional regulator
MVATDKGTETRRHIIDVAARAFAENGYAGTSLNDVIRATGLTKGGFYFHFESKSELALAVLDQVRADWRNSVLDAVSADMPAAERIGLVMHTLAAHKASHPGSRAVDRLCRELGETDPAVRGYVQFEDWYALAEQLLEQVRLEGDLDPMVDIPSAARFLVVAFVGGEHVADLTGEPFAGSIDSHIGYSLRAVGVRTS